MADKQLQNRPDSKKIIIMVTDGVPILDDDRVEVMENFSVKNYKINGHNLIYE